MGRFALSACLLALTSTAAAQSREVELVWSAPASCPDAAEVRARAERILNRPLTAPSGELRVTALVTAAGDAQPWRVRLETGAASRTVQAASCDELVSATAVFLAILLEPEADQPEPEPPSPAPPPPEPPEQPPALAPAPAHTRSWPFALGATLGARSALAPDLAFGLGLHGTWAWKAVRLSLGSSYWFPDQAKLDGVQQQGAEIQISSAFAEACAQLESSVLVAALCSGGELSRLRGEGYGPGVSARSSSAILGALSVGGALRLRQSERVSWLVDADAVFATSQRRFVFAGSAPARVHTPGAGFRLTIGAEWSL